MKKVVSILFASLILVSGMHLSIAMHICGGEVAAVKWSFAGEKASCGMENENSQEASGNAIKSNCCQNEVSFFVVDNNYSFSSFQIQDVVKKISQIIAVPVELLPNSTLFAYSSFENVSPPDKTIANAVCLADICVFRI